MFSLACVLAGGAFVLAMLKDPPASIASHPGAVTAKGIGVQDAADLPPLDCLSTSTVCQ